MLVFGFLGRTDEARILVPSGRGVSKVEFHSGAVYQYSGVDKETWEDFQSSDSIGRFFNQEIKGKFESELINLDDYC